MVFALWHKNKLKFTSPPRDLLPLAPSLHSYHRCEPCWRLWEKARELDRWPERSCPWRERRAFWPWRPYRNPAPICSSIQRRMASCPWLMSEGIAWWPDLLKYTIAWFTVCSMITHTEAIPCTWEWLRGFIVPVQLIYLLLPRIISWCDAYLLDYSSRDEPKRSTGCAQNVYKNMKLWIDFKQYLVCFNTNLPQWRVPQG